MKSRHDGAGQGRFDLPRFVAAQFIKHHATASSEGDIRACARKLLAIFVSVEKPVTPNEVTRGGEFDEFIESRVGA